MRRVVYLLCVCVYRNFILLGTENKLASLNSSIERYSKGVKIKQELKILERIDPEYSLYPHTIL